MICFLMDQLGLDFTYPKGGGVLGHQAPRPGRQESRRRPGLRWDQWGVRNVGFRMVLKGIPHTAQPHRGIAINLVLFNDFRSHFEKMPWEWWKWDRFYRGFVHVNFCENAIAKN